MKKSLALLGILILVGLFSTGWITHVDNWWMSNCQISNPTLSVAEKSVTASIGYLSATAINASAPVSSMVSAGLSGVAESGFSEGYVQIEEVADSLVFSVQMPSNLNITGTEGDLILEFDVAQNDGLDTTTKTMVVGIYGYGNDTQALVMDTVNLDAGVTRGLVGLTTNSAGLGNTTGIVVGQPLTVELSPLAADDTILVYGVRLRYKAGL